MNLQMFEKAEAPSLKMVMALGVVTVMWSASSYGYYVLVSTLAFENGYNDAPFLFAGYYLLWAGAAMLWFRDTLSARWSRDTLKAQALTMLPILAVCVLIVVFYLPSLPKIAFWKAPIDPPEFMFASRWYYLPKSADILFQQVLVAGIIRTAARQGYRLIAISMGMGILFGGFHLSLALDGFTPFYVARFTVAATLFGLVAPYLYLRFENGFQWAYTLHWTFYMFDRTLTNFLLASPPWMQSIL